MAVLTRIHGSPGCRLVGHGEHIPYGTPAGYPEARAERYREAQP